MFESNFKNSGFTFKKENSDKALTLEFDELTELLNTSRSIRSFTTDRQKIHGLAECLVIVTSRWDFVTNGVSFISTHIKSLTGLPASWRIKCW